MHYENAVADLDSTPTLGARNTSERRRSAKHRRLLWPRAICHVENRALRWCDMT